MIRQITYLASDGNSFKSRSEARRHEVELVRAQRITAFFAAHLTGESPILREIVAAIQQNSREFATMLSARAASRVLMKKNVSSNQ